MKLSKAVIKLVIIFGIFQFSFAQNKLIEAPHNSNMEISSVNATIVPYLQTPTSTSIYISWNSTAGSESTVKYGTSESLGSSASGTVHKFTAYTRWWHTVKLTGLTPETIYYYKVKSGTDESAVYRFKTPPTSAKKTGHIHIAVMGDSRSNPQKQTEVLDSMKSTISRLYSKNLEEGVNLLINVGDIVYDGRKLDQYEPQFFTPMQVFSPNVPTMVSIGNHERESDNYYYHMAYEDFGGAEGEKYYSFTLGRILFVALNSNTDYRNNTQITWLDNLLSNAQNNDDIDWIIVFAHHPGHSEYWVAGNTSYVQTRILPTLAKYSKVDLYMYGHSHDYERGALQDESNVRLLLSGGGGGHLDRYGDYGGDGDGQMDYPEIQKSFGYYNYVLIDFDIENKKYEAAAYTLGDDDTFRPNELFDTFYRDKNASAPVKPDLLAPETGQLVAYPFEIEAEDFTKTYDILCSQFQITSKRGSYVIPYRMVDEIRNFENIYGLRNIPYDRNARIELSKLKVTDDMSLRVGRTYWWRVRYRDKNLQWSEWSDERSFKLVTTDIEREDGALLPSTTKLYNNYPNPFNPTTVIKFAVNKGGYASLKIYNVTGELVKTLVNDVISAGVYTVQWNGKDNNNISVASGLYLYRLETIDFSETRKALLLK